MCQPVVEEEYVADVEFGRNGTRQGFRVPKFRECDCSSPTALVSLHEPPAARLLLRKRPLDCL